MSTAQTQPPGADREYDQRPAPDREKPDFAAIATQFTQYGAEDLEIIWERNDELASVRDFKFFLLYCKQHQLNPVAGEVVGSMRYDSIKRRMVMTPIVKIGVLRKRRALECDGLDEAKFTYEGTALVSASGSIYRKGSARPFSATVYYKEYAPLTNSGHVVSHWKDKPHIMLGACLEAQLTRIAFFDLCGDFLTDEETQTRERPTSTMDEPTAEDDARVSALTGKIGVKPTPAPAETKAAEPETALPTPAPLAPLTETVRPADDPLPAPCEGKPSSEFANAEEPKPLTLAERKAAILATLNLPDKAGTSLVNDYCRGFLATEGLPKKQEIYGPILDKLSADVADPLKRKAVIENPKAAGALAAGRAPDPLDVFATRYGWPADIVKTVREIGQARQQTPKDTVAWLTTLGLENATLENVTAFLPVAALTRQAYLVLDASRKYKLSVKVLVESMEAALGKKASEISTSALDEALGAMDQLLAAKYGQPEPEQEEMPF